jgi:hypothetical protein
MALRVQFAAPPADGLRLVRENAPMLLGPNVNGPDPTIGKPWPIYVQTEQKLANGQVVLAPRLAAWEYPILAGSTALGTAEISADPVEWAALHPPEHAQAIFNAIAFIAAQSHTFESNDSYELRILNVPSVALSALWLSGPDDRFVPITVVGTEFTLQVLDAEQLLNTVSEQLPIRLSATGARGA